MLNDFNPPPPIKTKPAEPSIEEEGQVPPVLEAPAPVEVVEEVEVDIDSRWKEISNTGKKANSTLKPIIDGTTCIMSRMEIRT